MLRWLLNAKELETQHNLKKWASIIKECRSSDMKILQWLEINNISKDQYYYWQRKLKETCIDTLERQAATFVELPVTKEAPASTTGLVLSIWELITPSYSIEIAKQNFGIFMVWYESLLIS